MSFIKRFLLNIGLLAAGIVLFSLSFPSFISDKGWGFLGFIALVPVFLLVKRVKIWQSPIWGFAYGYLTYTVFNFWLKTFDPISFVIVPIIYGTYFLLFFPVFSWVARKAEKYNWILLPIIWVAYEIVRSGGFLGYPYGTIGSSQYLFTPFIGISDLFGIQGVSFMVALCSSIIAWLIQNKVWKKDIKKPFLKPVILYIALFTIVLLYGFISKVNYSDSPTLRIALIQHNKDAWRKGIDVQKQAFRHLTTISQSAIENENPDLVVWPETAFVPSVRYYSKYRTQRDSVELVKKLQDFLEESQIPFLIGNNDNYNDNGTFRRYNSILQFDGEDIVETYHKIHLVPFGEHFPYEKLFPKLHAYIKEEQGIFYDKGDEYTIFNINGIKMSGLICFEDVFPYLSRNFVKEGSELLVNVTNDAWSQHPASCMQHVTLAVFRSVENRRSMVRSTCSGYTSVIDPNGKFIATIEPYTRDYLVHDTPIDTSRNTLFTILGSWFNWLIGALSIATITYLVYLEISTKKDEEDV